MGDNNPGQTAGPSMTTMNIQNVSQPTPQQQPMSPPTQQQTINIYTQQPSPPSQPQREVIVLREPPAQITQPPVQQVVQPYRPVQPLPPPVYQRGGKCLVMCYEFSKIIQIVVCIAFIIIGIFVASISLFDDDWKWRFTPHRRDDDFYWVHISEHTLDSLIWYNIIVSIFGLIGASGEVKCCQVTYAILVTPLFPLCIIPWFIVCGICNHWGKPQYHHYSYAHHY